MGQLKKLAEVRKPPDARVSTDREGNEHIFIGGEEMTEQAKEARRAYRREWNRKNKDKVRAAQNRYWERRAQAQRAQAQPDEPKQEA